MFETPITLAPSNTVGDALSLIHKRAHGAVIVVDDDARPIGVFTEHDAVGFDRFTQLRNVMSTELDTLPADVTAERAFERLHGARRTLAPVVDADGRLLGLFTSTGALRSTIYRPAVDSQGRLLVSVAVGINADPVGRATALVDDGRRRAGDRHRARTSDEDARRRRCRARRRARRRRSSPATSSRPPERAS